MPRADRRKPVSRCCLIAHFDHLEERQLLSAAPEVHMASLAHVRAVEIKAAHVKAAELKAAHIKAAEMKAAVAKAAHHHVKASATPVQHALPLQLKIFHQPNHATSRRLFNGLPGGITPVGSTPIGGTPIGISPIAAGFSPVVGAYSPTQLQTAYGVNLLGLSNQGQGVTIGIVDEFDDPNITADANAYSAQYGLPQFDGLNGNPVLSVVKDTALGPVVSGAGTGVGLETSLDVEMAHAMAPKANILLVEVPATVSVANEFRELLHGGQLAAGQSVNGAPVVVVSTSYGFSEQQIGNANVVSLNNTFLTTGPSTTVAMTFSTGDGSTPLFPATSPNVIGVGGTALYLASARGRYSEEIAWGGLAGAGAGGGGTSTNFTVPTFQSLNTVNFSGKRSIPDISMNADVVTAASVFDSFDQASNGGDPWQGVGGTSEASPLFAGVLALAQQRRLAASLPILNSVQINNILYAAYTSANYLTYFHDITLGNNSNVDGSGTTTVAGFNAGARYDLATGIGSPIVNTLVPLLSEQNPTP